MVELAVNLGLPVAIIVVAMITGTLIEKRHFRSIERREAALQDVAILNGKGFPTDLPVEDARMVTGSVVVSIDYFKRFLASLRNIVGGEVRSYCSLLDRGRREALLRLKEEAAGANLIVNVRVETSSVSRGGRKALGSTEVLAYGTAVRYRKAGAR